MGQTGRGRVIGIVNEESGYHDTIDSECDSFFLVRG
jgi:hypothetical protein